MIFVKLPASCRDRIWHCDNPTDRTDNCLSLLFTSFKAASESLHDNLSWKSYFSTGTLLKANRNTTAHQLIAWHLHYTHSGHPSYEIELISMQTKAVQRDVSNSQSCSDSRAFDCLPIPISSLCNWEQGRNNSHHGLSGSLLKWSKSPQRKYFYK